jgi:hypothetical protein
VSPEVDAGFSVAVATIGVFVTPDDRPTGDKMLSFDNFGRILHA